MKLHKTEKIDNDWRRKAVPGGWLYYAEMLIHPDEGQSDWHIQGATYVPDPAAEHVRNARGEVTP